MEIQKLRLDFIQHLKRQGKSDNTIKNYGNDLNVFVKYLLEKKKSTEVEEFNPAQVMAYSSFLDAKYKSDNSRRRRVQALRLFFDFLVEKGKWQENPVRKIPVSPKKLYHPKPVSYNDLLKLSNYLKEKSKSSTGLEKLNALRNLVIIHLIYGSALKVSDLTDLPRKCLTETNKKYRVLITPPKRDPYSIPIHTEFDKLYKQYIKEIRIAQNEIGFKFKELLYNANAYKILSGKLSPRGLEVLFEQLGHQVGIKITPKSLRQAAIIRWLQEKKNITTIKEWMGVRPSYDIKLYNEYVNDMKTHQKYASLSF